MKEQPQLLASLGTDYASKREISLDRNWLCFSLNHDSKTSDVPIILIERGPKNIAEIKKHLKNYDTCIVLFAERNTLFLKSPNKSHTAVLENDSEYERIASILSTCGFADATHEIDIQLGINKAIDKIPNATGDFENRGLFSTHYLRSRLFSDSRLDIDGMIPKIKKDIGNSPDKILKILGWDISSSNTYHNGKVSITITDQDDFSIRKMDADVAPSYTAVATLRKTQWAILTNGKKWRLYTNRISASSTNYFEIILDPARDSVIKYLIVLFSSASFENTDNKIDIEVFFEEGRNYATELEDDLFDKITDSDGLFLDIVKGVLDHDMKKTFSSDELDAAKQTALKIMYRIWFVAYAESRNLLPVNDSKYRSISLQSIRSQLDSYEEKSKETKCYDNLKILFGGIRKGSIKHNLPQYDGNLFKHEISVDGITIQNQYVVSALRGLLEQDGDAVDYANLSVRHLGNIFESLMEFAVRQADKDIMLLEYGNSLREVKTVQESTYSYKKNDLYLASKGGIASRKTTASFYTPDEIVKFLVNSGLEPIFKERQLLLKKDMERYFKNKSDKNRQICMERLLDLQVLDPSMGSGHFLVEALNRITQWATNMLDAYPDHPLLEDIEQDRKTVITEQNKKGIILEENLLTHDVLLKRKIMKRCIFGVDVNPMAVDLAKLSLWLDSFAIGVPLTYMDHHIKIGDSTIGMFLDDLKNRDIHSLDDFMPSEESKTMICDVISSSDITVSQVHQSEDNYRKHLQSLEPHKRVLDALAASKIILKFLPVKSKNEFIHKFRSYSKTESNDFKQARKTISELVERHKIFHWEIEMMDAFTDSRRGFDLIVGNPPWEKIKPSDDEFFTPYDPTFRSLKPNTKKIERKNELCKDSKINDAYKSYKNIIGEKTAFYKIYDMQGSGDKDLWKLILERTLNLLGEGGIISMVIPSQILSNPGTAYMRRNLLEKDILSLYVFENRNKIFPIDSRIRFTLLSVCNSDGPDEFPVGFYLHNLKSLEDKNIENEKMGMLSKQKLLDSVNHIIPEKSGVELEIYEKISQNNTLGDGLGEGWDIGLTRGFDRTNDADLLKEDGKGWPVHEGKTIHQYNHRWAAPVFAANKKEGLERENGRRIFMGNHEEIYDSFRLIFRNISSPTNMRTSISTIIPPHQFYTNALRSIVLTHDGNITLDAEYDKKIVYLCGIINSLTFDFTCRVKIQTNFASIIKSLPIPNPIHEDRISRLVGKLVVGTPEFEGLAESLRIPNVTLAPAQRIEIAAELDALVALEYNLTKIEYKTIIDSFPAFKKNQSLYNELEILWDNKNLKEFYGEMADLALQYFEVIKHD